MARILQWVTLLFGVLLLSIVSLLENADREQQLSTIIFLSEGQNGGDSLHSYFPETRRQAQLTPHLNQRRFTEFRDDLWLYVYSADATPQSDWETPGLYRVRVDGRVVQQVARGGFMSHARQSPDKKWIIGLVWDEQLQQWNLIKIILETGESQMIMAWPFENEVWPFLISPDGTQLAFSVIPNDEHESQIFVVSTSGGTPRNLTAHLGGDYDLALWTAGDEWLVAHHLNQVVALRPDGSDMQPIVPPGIYSADHRLWGWVESRQLIIIRGDNQELFGMHIGQPSPSWMVNGYGAVMTPDERYLIYQLVDGEENTLWKLPLEGGVPQLLARLPLEAAVQYLFDPLPRISPDTHYALLVASSVEINAKRHLIQVNLRIGAVKTLFIQTALTAPDAYWLADGKWISVYDGHLNDSYWGDTLYLMQADGSDRHTLKFGEGRPYPLWWLQNPSPPQDRHQPYPLMVGGAGLLILSVILAWRRKATCGEF